jgi:flagellar FliL protein
MPPKPEPTPAPAATPAPAPAAAPVGSSGSKITALIPVILVVVLAPVVSWAVAQFVIIPKMEARLTAAVSKAVPATAAGEAAAEEAAPAEAASARAGGHGAPAKKGDTSPTNSYEFSNVVVNLAGTMGTRYLKATFMVTGKDPHIRDTFNKEKARLVDVTLNVLSSLSLADLEEAGAKNIIREKLVNAYNQALGRKVVEQIYFSDFVVQ